MFITHRKKLGVALALVLLLAVTLLLLTAHVNKPSWWSVADVKPSADGRTLTAELLFPEPKADGTFCQQVTNTVVEESTSQVVVGAQVYSSCAPLLSWGQVTMTAEGHPFYVDLHLRAPLAGRTVVDKASGQRIPIPGPSG